MLCIFLSSLYLWQESARSKQNEGKITKLRSDHNSQHLKHWKIIIAAPQLSDMNELFCVSPTINILFTVSSSIDQHVRPSEFIYVKNSFIISSNLVLSPCRRYGSNVCIQRYIRKLLKHVN